MSSSVARGETMKTMLVLIGIVIMVVGVYYAYSGYELKQTTAASVEKEVSAVAKILSNNSYSGKEQVNNEADIKLVAGGIGALVGLLLIIRGLEKKQQM
jgi:hypothetical protein